MSTMRDRRVNNGSATGQPLSLPSGYDWAAFLRRHARRIRFRNDGCWEWLGAKVKPGGYGAVSIGRTKALRAHRVTWTLLVGPLPPRLTLDHLCRRPACINPDHMELVTAGENRRRAPLSGAARTHASKTHCPAGHAYDRIDVLGRRVCRTCHRAASNRYVARKRAERAQVA